MDRVEEREKRQAIMAIRENTPSEIEKEILKLIESGYKLRDLHRSGYSQHLYH